MLKSHVHTFARLLHVAKQADGFTYERSAIEQWLENLLTLAFPLVVYCSKCFEALELSA